MLRRPMRPVPGTAFPFPGRVPYLDGLRGIAILLVIALHFLHLPFNPAKHPNSWFLPFYHLLGAGWVGVDLFFVLSGFLLGGVLMDNRYADNLLRVFYLRRAGRILPAYFLLLLPLFIVPTLGLADRIPALAKLVTTGDIPLWTYPLFLQNIAMTLQGSWGEAWISTTWSLAVEEQFYLLLPAILLLTPSRRLPVVLVLLALLAPALRIGLYLGVPHPHSEIGAYTLLPCRWDSLLLGVLAAWLVRYEPSHTWLHRRAAALRVGVLVLGATGLALAILSPELTTALMDTVGYSLFAVFFATVVISAELGSLPGLALLEWKPLRWVGRISYMLYLSHATVCSVLFHLVTRHNRTLDSARDAGLMALSFALSLLLAGLSWKWFEQPILTRARRFSYRTHRA